ncbi:carboxymuconolactone decarboxylase family protein [Gryllotalpicola reticulitermitis]|uniref:Carboxymuconolactone decarboxylase family protein n=1 Tax=Gryllotalpicola reticulitermitis TaxID=1184153 RepID=A0ABV8Q1D2_9MICO
MRLPDIERGENLRSRALIRIISAVSGIRLPDAARVAFYDKGFVGPTFGAWTQALMRGPSEWSVGERELMAAMVAHWNSCTFCVGAHSAIAVRGLDRDTVNACLADYRTAPISEPLRASLSFLETMTREPETLSAAHAQAALKAGASQAQLADAAAVAAIFNITTHYADTLDFAIPTDDEFDKAAGMMLKRGYR